MRRKCPNCSATINLAQFFVLRLMWHHCCNKCRSQLEFTGVIHWGLAIAELLVCLAVYRAVEGNSLQSIACVAVAILIAICEFQFWRIEAVKG
jgi:hypothetical protein